VKLNVSTVVKFLLLFAFGVFLIWLSVKNIGPEQRQEIVTAFSDLKFGWVYLSIFCALMSNVSRGHRWKMMLDALGKITTFLNCFLILLVNSFANLAFPRLGEALRCGLIQRYEKISFDKVLGTVVIDRVVDILTLGLIFVFVLFVERDVLGAYANENIIEPLFAKLQASGSSALFLLAILLLLAVAGFFVLRRLGFWKKAKGLLENVWSGLTSITKMKNWPLFVFHSLFIWSMYFAMLYLLFQASPLTEHLSAMSGLATLAFAAFAIALTPGGIGAYPIIVQSILGQYGLEGHIAYGFGTLAWVVQTATIIVGGFLSLVALPNFNRRATELSD